MTHFLSLRSRAARVVLLTGLMLAGSALVIGFAAAAKRASISTRSTELELAQLKTRIEQPGSSAELIAEYDRLLGHTAECPPAFKGIRGLADRNEAIMAPSICLSGGSLAAGDPTYNRVLTSSTGTGVGNGTLGNCSLSGSGTATRYDAYTFNVFGCSTFPTVVTVSLCDGVCGQASVTDTVLVLYRKVAAGDALTANGGLPGPFIPATACTNVIGANDDTSAAAIATGGSTCNQTVPSDCTTACPSTGVSQMKRNLGSGLFTVVVTTFGNTGAGAYNLFVNAPAAGCQIAQTTLAAGGTITGRVMTASGVGVGKATVQVTDQTGRLRTVLTNGFGYYQMDNLTSGQTYVVAVADKQYTFLPQVVELTNAIQGVDFTALP